VCVVLLTGLGDVVNALPLVNALKDADPTLRISWVVEPMPAPILAHHPSVDEVIVYRKKLGVQGVRQLAAEMFRQPRWDLAINLHVFAKSIWGTMFSRAPHRVGFDRARTFDQTWLVTNDRIAPRPRRHTVDMFLEFAAHLGAPVAAPEWRITFTDAERAEQAAFFAGMDRPLVGLIPASNIARKDWIAERWIPVVDALETEFGCRTVIMGGLGEREVRMAREISDGAAHKPLWAMGDPIRRMAWMIEGCALTIAPDTGPLHMSRALQTPVIGLYGHTSPWRVGPHGRYHDLLVDRYLDPGEAPDPSSYAPRLGRMEQITPDDVIARIRVARERYGLGGAGDGDGADGGKRAPQGER
jgi:heptosyltransferase I